MNANDCKNSISWFKLLCGDEGGDGTVAFPLCEQAHLSLCDALKNRDLKIDQIPALYCLVAAMAYYKHCLIKADSSTDIKLGDVTVKLSREESLARAKQLLDTYTREAGHYLKNRRIFKSVGG